MTDSQRREEWHRMFPNQSMREGTRDECGTPLVTDDEFGELCEYCVIEVRDAEKGEAK